MRIIYFIRDSFIIVILTIQKKKTFNIMNIINITTNLKELHYQRIKIKSKPPDVLNNCNVNNVANFKINPRPYHKHKMLNS